MIRPSVNGLVMFSSPGRFRFYMTDARSSAYRSRTFCIASQLSPDRPRCTRAAIRWHGPWSATAGDPDCLVPPSPPGSPSLPLASPANRRRGSVSSEAALSVETRLLGQLTARKQRAEAEISRLLVQRAAEPLVRAGVVLDGPGQRPEGREQFQKAKDSSGSRRPSAACQVSSAGPVR